MADFGGHESCTPVGAWALRLNDGTELKLSYRWEGPDNKPECVSDAEPLYRLGRADIAETFLDKKIWIEMSYVSGASAYLLSLFVLLQQPTTIRAKYTHDLATLQQSLREEYGHVGKDPKHLGPPMGVPNPNCDDGKHGIETDWNPLSDTEYTCFPSDRIQTTAQPVHIDEPESNAPLWHICLDKEIKYNTPLPLGGNHRPLWPAYGEYIYLPPQRWVHGVEHGAVVLLYHPCMRRTIDLEELKGIVKGCLRKHLISPYRKLPDSHPFAIITYHHGLLLSHFDGNDHLQYNQVITFIKKYGQKAPEHRVWEDGQYSVGLLYPADMVSDQQDSKLCPQF